MQGVYFNDVGIMTALKGQEFVMVWFKRKKKEERNCFWLCYNNKLPFVIVLLEISILKSNHSEM